MLHWIELSNLGLEFVLVFFRSILDFLCTISIPLDTLRLELFGFRKALSPLSSLSIASAGNGSAMDRAVLLDKLKLIDLEGRSSLF